MEEFDDLVTNNTFKAGDKVELLIDTLYYYLGDKFTVLGTENEYVYCDGGLGAVHFTNIKLQHEE